MNFIVQAGKNVFMLQIAANLLKIYSQHPLWLCFNIGRLFIPWQNALDHSGLKNN